MRNKYTLRAAMYYRNVSAIVKDLSSVPTQVQQLVKYAESCVETSIQIL